MSYGASTTPEFVLPADSMIGGGARISSGGAQVRRAQRTRVKSARRRRRAGRIGRLLPMLCAIAAAGVFVSLTDGGRQARDVVPLRTHLGHALAKVGMGLSEVTLAGQRMTSDTAIYDKLRLEGERSIWLLDIKAARRRIETLGWVESASLKRLFPDRLHVAIVERRAHAIWNDSRRTILVDASGRALGPASGGEAEAGLPVVYGPGGGAPSGRIIQAVARIPDLHGRVAVYERVAERRWTLHLTTGQRILLPANGESRALLTLVEGREGNRLLDTDFVELDLRVGNQVAIAFQQ